MHSCDITRGPGRHVVFQNLFSWPKNLASPHIKSRDKVRGHLVVCPSLPANNRPELVDVTCECAHWPTYCKLWRDELELRRRTAVIDASARIQSPQRDRFLASLLTMGPRLPDKPVEMYIYGGTEVPGPTPLFFHENIIVLVPWARGAVPSGQATWMRECRRPQFVIHHIACAAGGRFALRPWHRYLRIPRYLRISASWP
jgi:hypothetical protein